MADYLFRSGRLDEAAQTYQQILEAGSAPPGLMTSLVHSALGQIDYLQERLFAAGGEFEQALAAFPANVDAQAGLGDLALRAGEAADALAAYDAAIPFVPAVHGWAAGRKRGADQRPVANTAQFGADATGRYRWLSSGPG